MPYMLVFVKFELTVWFFVFALRVVKPKNFLAVFTFFGIGVLMQFNILFVVSCLMQMRRVADKSLPMNGCIPFLTITYCALFVVQLLHSIGDTSATNVVTGFQLKNYYIALFLC